MTNTLIQGTKQGQTGTSLFIVSKILPSHTLRESNVPNFTT